jgi:hypothetical protein
MTITIVSEEWEARQCEKADVVYQYRTLWVANPVRKLKPAITMVRKSSLSRALSETFLHNRLSGGTY